MLKLVAEEIAAWCSFDDPRTDLSIANHILSKTEASGMLPPSMHSKLTNIEGDRVGEMFVCQWEPEDEEI
jgi:hypothetical protein